MPEVKDRTGERMGPYRLEERLKSAGPGGGCLYLAHHRRTGARAVLLLPVEGVHPRPRASWRVRMSGRKEPSAVTIELGRPSQPMLAKDLSEALSQMTTEVLRVEDPARLTAYLLARPVEVPPSARWKVVLGVLGGVLGLLALGAGLWLYRTAGS